MKEFIVGAALEESTGGTASKAPLAGAATEEPLVRAVTEDPVTGVATEEELSAGVDKEEATEGVDLEEATEGVDVEEATAGVDMEEATAGVAIEMPIVKKLLVLDVNGLLVATYHKAQKMPGDMHPFKLGNFFVYERPGCSEFLDFCFKNFVVGVWSSAREHNVTNLVNHIFKDLKEDLFFSWHQRHCTTTAVKHPDNENKPIFLKELSKLWTEVDSGRFDQSNTLLIDDSPYKALRNPPHTAIFPHTYNGDEVDDNFLTVLRRYLEGLRDAPDVQEYVRNNPIGVPGISSESPLWGYFAPILKEGARELNLAVTGAVGNGATPALASTQHVHEFARQLNPEEIELEDMEQPAKRRDLSPVGVAGHSRRREPQGDEETHWRRNVGNELETDRTHSRRNFERERERSPRIRMKHFDRRRFATSRERDTAEIVHHPRSNYIGDYHTRRDDKSRGSWHDRSGVRDTSLSRESFGRRSSEHDIGRALPSPGGRQFITSGINIRDLPPPPVFSTPDTGRGLLPPPVLPPRTWDNAERPTLHYDSYGGRRHVSNVALSAPMELARSWELPVIPARGREYDRRWDNPVSASVVRGYDRGAWARPVSSGRGSEFDRRWDEPVGSGRGNEFDRRWDEPVSSGRGHEYDRRWEATVDSARGSEYDRRWKEPVGSARGSEYNRRWREPVSVGRERGYDSGFDRPASSSHGKEYDSRWGEPAPAANIGRGREHGTRWDEPVHSNSRKSDYDRRWELPLNSGSTRDYDSKWSKAPISQFAPPPTRVEYSSQGYRNPSADYKGRYPHADRNMAVGPRDDTRPYHWGASNSYRR